MQLANLGGDPKSNAGEWSAPRKGRWLIKGVTDQVATMGNRRSTPLGHLGDDGQVQLRAILPKRQKAWGV